MVPPPLLKNIGLFLAYLAAFYLLAEQGVWLLSHRLLWRPLERFCHLPAMGRLEIAIRKLTPPAAFILCFAPLLLAWPAKTFGVWMMAFGRFHIGVCLYAVGQLFTIIITAWLYLLCRPAMREMTWFAAAESVVLRWSGWVRHRSGTIVPGGGRFGLDRLRRRGRIILAKIAGYSRPRPHLARATLQD